MVARPPMFASAGPCTHPSPWICLTTSWGSRGCCAAAGRVTTSSASNTTGRTRAFVITDSRRVSDRQTIVAFSLAEDQGKHEFAGPDARAAPDGVASRTMTTTAGPGGLARGLTNYGDPDFSLYLRRSFATSMGYSREMLARPVVGIAQSASGV